jgi:hypothetical protein
MSEIVMATPSQAVLRDAKEIREEIRRGINETNRFHKEIREGSWKSDPSSRVVIISSHKK